MELVLRPKFSEFVIEILKDEVINVLGGHVRDQPDRELPGDLSRDT